MGLLATLARPYRGAWLLRRVLVEVRLQRRATERIADALELAAMTSPTSPGTTFRSYAQTKRDLSDAEVKGLSEVAYVDEKVLGEILGKEDELRAILGRDPSPEELERAYVGEIE